MYMYSACSFHAYKGEEWLQLWVICCLLRLYRVPFLLWWPSCTRRSRYKPSTKGDKYFFGYQRPFLVNPFVTFLLDCKFGKMILPGLKNSILVLRVLQVELSLDKESSVFLVSIIFCIWTRMCTKHFTENVTSCANSVYQVSPQREGPGDKATLSRKRWQVDVRWT